MTFTAPDDRRFPDTDEMTLEAFLSELADLLEEWVPRLPPEWPDRGLYCGLLLRLRAPVLERLIGTRTRTQLSLAVPRPRVTAKPARWVDLEVFAEQMRAATAKGSRISVDMPPVATRRARRGSTKYPCAKCGEAMRAPTPAGLCGFCLSEAVA